MLWLRGLENADTGLGPEFSAEERDAGIPLDLGCRSIAARNICPVRSSWASSSSGLAVTSRLASSAARAPSPADTFARAASRSTLSPAPVSLRRLASSHTSKPGQDEKVLPSNKS